MKTIRELANELNINKNIIHNEIINLGLKEKLTVQGNKFLLNKQQEELIINALNIKKKENDQYINNKEYYNKNNITYMILQSQLENKDKQLENKDKQLESLNEQIANLIKQNEQLTEALQNTTDSLKSAQALHAGTIQQQLNDSNVKEEKQIKKWWKFWR